LSLKFIVQLCDTDVIMPETECDLPSGDHHSVTYVRCLWFP